MDGIFDAKVDDAPVIRRHEEEEAQVEALVKKRKAFSASGIYTNIGTMCVTSEAVLKAGRQQLELVAKENEAKVTKRRVADNKKLAFALEAKKKHQNGEKIKLTELKGALWYCLKETGSFELMSTFNTRDKVQTRLNSFEKEWWSYIPAEPVTEGGNLDKNTTINNECDERFSPFVM